MGCNVHYFRGALCPYGPSDLPVAVTTHYSCLCSGIFSAHALARVVNSKQRFLTLYMLVLSHTIEHHRSCHYVWLSIRCLCDKWLLSACALRTLTAQQTYPGRGSISTVISSSIPFTLVHYTLNRTRFICSANEKPMARSTGVEPISSDP